MAYIKKLHILGHEESAWGLTGRAGMVVNLSTDGITAYTNALLNVTSWQASLYKESKLR